MKRVIFVAGLLAACVQKAPHANVVLSGTPTSHAVLVLPTACLSRAYAALCAPSTYASDKDSMHRYLPTFAAHIDPALRLKLELAGFTLAEGAAMRLVTADRVETNGATQIVEGEGPQTVADLPMPDVFAVARSLSLPSVIISQLTIHPDKYAMYRGELVVTLVDVATNEPRWSVTCSEILYNALDVPNRLANCAGNGVLAAFAPDNLIGKSL